MATQKQIGEHLDLSDRSIRYLIARRVFERSRRRTFDVDACRRAYIRHLREIAAGRAPEVDTRNFEAHSEVGAS